MPEGLSELLSLKEQLSSSTSPEGLIHVNAQVEKVKNIWDAILKDVGEDFPYLLQLALVKIL